MTDIRVPTLGKSVTEATIGKWFKKPGDAVADSPVASVIPRRLLTAPDENAPVRPILQGLLRF